MRVTSPAMTYEDIARICHEVNRAYCTANGDTSQAPWAEALDWQKYSAINGVKFHLNNETTPKDSHISWLNQKREEGWTYGPVKDAAKRTHPCMVEYEQLPREQQIKDYLFKAVVDCFKGDQK